MAVNGEEMVDQLVKRVRMPPSAVVPVGVVFLVGGVSHFIVFTEDLEKTTIDGGAPACCSPQ
jgi:hypothetical protein